MQEKSNISNKMVTQNDEEDNYESLYNSDDDSKHSTLVSKVLSLHKTQNVKKSSRTEPSINVSEFNLVASGNEATAVRLEDLTNPLRARKNRAKISDRVAKLKKTAAVLPKPLEKPQADKIARSVNYEKARLALDRWEGVVTSNRVQPQIQFPLESDLKLEKKSIEIGPTAWTLKTPLERELDSLNPNKASTDTQPELQFKLTEEEMLERRREAAKMRAYQSVLEAKARRRNKIKSKKYHRIQKRERIKKQLKEFEELQKRDPERALEKLEEIERARVEERFSLRHKSTGQWARSRQVRAKYDRESRQVLAQQLTIGKELTAKIKDTADQDSDHSDKELNEGEILSAFNEEDKDNPWVNGMKPDKEVMDFVSGYRKYWNEKNKESGEVVEKNQAIVAKETDNLFEKEIAKVIEQKTKGPAVKSSKKKRRLTSTREKPEPQETIKKRKKLAKSTSAWTETTLEEIFGKLERKTIEKRVQKLKNLDKTLSQTTVIEKQKKSKYKVDLSLPNRAVKPIIDEPMDERPNSTEATAPSSVKPPELTTDEISNADKNIDADKYLKMPGVTRLSTAVPDLVTDDTESENRQAMCEAFEDDQVTEEFRAEKQKEVESDRPKDIDLSLPGWGSWGGDGIKHDSRKKKRFTVKAPPVMPRRDDNRGDLIVNEKAAVKIKSHLVSELPFPFKSVKDFEASIRAPIGSTFVTETAFRKLTRPAVVTKLGAIIKPMSKDYVLEKNS